MFANQWALVASYFAVFTFGMIVSFVLLAIGFIYGVKSSYELFNGRDGDTAGKGLFHSSRIPELDLIEDEDEDEV